jgi:hypothetical protein
MTRWPRRLNEPPARERNHLAQADRQIRAVKRRIYDQERLIERLADEGQSTDDAFTLLNLLIQSLRQCERHRLLVLEQLAKENDQEF